MSLVRSEPGAVWRLTLTRPEARNAASAALLSELLAALGDAAADPVARVVLLAGEGADFCAGADLGELEEAAGGAAGIEYGGPLEEVLSALEDHPLPVIAAIQGAALGAGCQIALACDLVVAAADARLGIPSSRLGVVVSFETVQRLVVAIGPKRAAEMLLAGRTVTGEEAAAWGLVNDAVDPDRLAARAGELTEGVVSGAPLSVRASKRGVREALATLALDRATESFRIADFEMMASEAFSSEDLREGIRAFRERRPPEFRGR